MNRSALKTHQKSDVTPILIVDKIGVIGLALAEAFSQDYLIVLVSPTGPADKNEKIIHIPFKKRIPKAPDNKYSKIFIVDDGRSVTRQSAFSFITKARETDSPLFFIGSIRNVDVKQADEIANSYSKAKVLIFGDLFDKNIFFDRNEAINRYIIQARKNSKILVDGNGLALSFPISFEDTIKLIIKASYLEIAQKIILLFYPHPITDISLANLFQKIDPDIAVDFTKERGSRQIYIPQGAQHAISEYKLEDRIRKLDLEDKENRQIKIINRNESSRKSVMKPTFFLILILLFLVLLPFLTTSAYLFLGQKEIKSARISAQYGDFEKARKQVGRSITFFNIALKTSRPLSAEAKIVGMEDGADKIIEKIEAGKSISLSGIYLLDGTDLLKNIYSGNSKDARGDFSKASNAFKSAVGLIQKTKAEGKLSEEYSRDFDNLEPFIDLFSNSENILPQLLGFDREKTYLVLLQDSTELRPGGGRIDAIGILKIKDGRIIEFETSLVKEIDQKPKARIEPPFALRRYMSLDNLGLEDSNFDPDFVNSAIISSNIYSLATQNKVDGVIGADSVFAKNIISALRLSPTGGSDLSENENYMIQVANSIKKNLEKGDKPYFVLTQEVGKSIKEKHLMFAFPIPSFQNIFTANNWSSSLWDSRKKDGTKINDYLGLSEANLGNNGANRFVSRSVSKTLVVSEQGNVSSKLAIGFKNNSSGKEKLDYKNYLQLILPEGSILKAISIDNKQVEIEKAVTDASLYQAKNFKPPQGLEVDEKNEMDKAIFGFAVIVPAGGVKTISVLYDLPYTLPPVKKSIDYSLKVYKQPGLDSYPFDLAFELPQNYHTVGSGQLSQEIKTDKEILLTIAQK